MEKIYDKGDKVIIISKTCLPSEGIGRLKFGNEYTISERVITSSAIKNRCGCEYFYTLKEDETWLFLYNDFESILDGETKIKIKELKRRLKRVFDTLEIKADLNGVLYFNKDIKTNFKFSNLE